MAQKLTADARKAALARLAGWSDMAGRDAIAKKFVVPVAELKRVRGGDSSAN